MESNNSAEDYFRADSTARGSIIIIIIIIIIIQLFNSVQFSSVLYYVCASTTATKPITETAHEHKTNTERQ